MLEAYVYALQGQPDMARDILEATLPLIERTNDLVTLSAALLNLGSCASDQHDWPAAQGYLERATRLAKEMHLPLDVARIQWNLASTHAGQGDFATAISLLDTTRLEFLTRGLPIETALCSLELADTLLAAGLPERAQSLCAELSGDLVALQMPSNALAAVACLNEALTRSRIAHVKTYFEQLEREPTLAFLPPA